MKFHTISLILIISLFMLTCDDQKLPAPGYVAATDGDEINRIAVTWNAVDGAMTYHIYRSTVSYDGYTEIGTSGDSSAFYDNPGASDSAVTYGRLYYYKLRSWSHHSGFSDFSNYDSGYYKRPTPTTADKLQECLDSLSSDEIDLKICDTNTVITYLNRCYADPTSTSDIIDISRYIKGECINTADSTSLSSSN